MIVLGSYFLYRTESKTSAVLLLIAMTVGMAFAKYDRKYLYLVLGFLASVVCCAALLAYHYSDTLSAWLSDEGTLTGRVQIWPLLADYWQDHKWLGAGFGSFWNIQGAQPIEGLTQGWISQITSAHNGYLDLVVQVGTPGLVIAIFAALVAPLRRLLVQTRIDRARACLLLSILCFCLGHNFTESSLFDRDAIPQVFLMLSIGLLSAEWRSTLV